MSGIKPETVVSRSADAISREINGAVVLLTPEDSRVHVLDEVGSRIWALCADPVSINGLAAAIASEYEVEEEQAAADIIEFVRKLTELGVMRAG